MQCSFIPQLTESPTRILDRGFTVDEVVDALTEKGIGTSLHFIPLHLQPYWRDTYSLVPEMFPVASDLYERTFSLPIYTRMTDADVDRVIEALWTVLGR